MYFKRKKNKSRVLKYPVIAELSVSPFESVRYCFKYFVTVVRYLKWSEVKVVQLCLTLWPHGLYSSWNSPGQNTGVGSLSLLQGIFPTQGMNAGLLHCRQILYQLSHKGSPWILEWVAQPRNRTGLSCIAGGLFTNWAVREASC